MNYFCALIYGIVQGLTEFLPVSSSGHLALLPHFLEIKDPGIAFDLAMHVGTALAIMLYFKKEVLTLIKEYLLLFTFKKSYKDLPFATNFLVATFCTFVTAMSFKGLAESYGRSETFIAVNLIVFGILMVIVDMYCRQNDEDIMFKGVKLKHSFWIGLLQSLALFPGVSRSGITMTTARYLNLSRDEASRFSFLLSLPLIVGGAILKLPDLFSGDGQISLSISLFGVFIAFVVGILTIHYFLKVIKKIGLIYFGVYRVILAIGVLWLSSKALV
ncbi:undecaprenyl-diphosphate phosphatase [Halobacteriovorax sp. GB3]|uniref:undecaprenyl-diphosphate phosphatase n=1 Tax=Halobacteriovorax sp. GB3 TaxID=2719615 RepID=UPI002360B763|nr:undecaprenyl-diphosphate phosphatase [Halobacteriovorax sp. GB3]MDD0852328.1 undecaprenyl-diphosphate phosphatase [Halobacteriovorax sp. GB3]